MKIIKKDVFGPQFSDNASNTPNIDLVIIARSQYNLRSTIASRLNIGAKVIMNEARVTQIHDFYLNWRVRFHKDVLRLEVRVNDAQRVNGGKCGEDLSGDCADGGNGEEGRVFAVGYEEIVLEQVCLNEQVLAIVDH